MNLTKTFYFIFFNLKLFPADLRELTRLKQKKEK